MAQQQWEAERQLRAEATIIATQTSTVRSFQSRELIPVMTEDAGHQEKGTRKEKWVGSTSTKVHVNETDGSCTSPGEAKINAKDTRT